MKHEGSQRVEGREHHFLRKQAEQVSDQHPFTVSASASASSESLQNKPFLPSSPSCFGDGVSPQPGHTSRHCCETVFKF